MECGASTFTVGKLTDDKGKLEVALQNLQAGTAELIIAIQEEGGSWTGWEDMTEDSLNQWIDERAAEVDDLV